jgi:hypothetical protein
MGAQEAPLDQEKQGAWSARSRTSLLLLSRPALGERAVLVPCRVAE